MAFQISARARENLRNAFADQSLCLYLGAGVSVGSRLPTWEKLVAAMYFAVVAEQKMDGWRPFHNYLFAISEWYLKRLNEPLEVTARKTRSLFRFDAEGDRHFLRAVQEALYGVDPLDQQVLPPPEVQGNNTLQAVADLCSRKAQSVQKLYGVRSVITYNYDNLLEIALKNRRQTVSVFSEKLSAGERLPLVRVGKLPIFHAHGYVPHPRTTRTKPSKIVFTEEEYNRAAIDPYSWSNIVQIREMSGSTGLMVGLSLSDRNIRRLLDALQRSPVRPEIYALIQRPNPVKATAQHTKSIHKRAIALIGEFQKVGIKGNFLEGQAGGTRSEPQRTKGLKQEIFAGVKSERLIGRSGETQYNVQIREILSHVDRLEQGFQEVVLGSLGVTPIWYDKHEEVANIIQDIFN